MKMSLLLLVIAGMILLVVNSYSSSAALVSDGRVPSGREQKVYNYKLSNTSNVVLQTKPEVQCEWKPKHLDDGFKDCEAEFMFENRNIIRPTIASTVLVYNFANNNYTNLLSSFSYDYVTVNETYDNETTDPLDDTVFETRRFRNYGAVPATIDTSVPFAVRIKYIAPKYSSNQFNFSLTAVGFSARIDPTQSSCGTLSSPGTYEINQSINSSGGDCLIIASSNITINATTGSILFSNGSGKGIQSTSTTFTNITVRGTRIENFSMGIQLQNAENFTVINNTINLMLVSSSSGEGLEILNSRYGNISHNIIYINNTNSHGIEVFGGEATDHSIHGNNITVRSSGQVGIRLGVRSHRVNITNNTINTRGPNSYDILISNSNYTFIENNTLISDGSNAHALFHDTSYFGNVNFNNITTLGGGSGIRADTINSTTYEGNIINTSSGSGITLTTGSGNVTIIGSIINAIGDGIEIVGGFLFNITSNDVTVQNANNALDLSSGFYNGRIEQNNFTSIAGDAVVIADSNHSRFSDNFINATGSSADAIFLTSNANNITLHNNTLLSQFAFEISDSSGTNTINYLIYNNSFGQIEWTNTTFLSNMDVNVSSEDGMGLGRNIFIGNNTVAFNTTTFLDVGSSGINSSANITLFGLNLTRVIQILRVENYTTTSAEILSAGSDCITGGTCVNISYVGSTLLFNTTSFSSFAATDPQITLLYETCGAHDWRVGENCTMLTTNISCSNYNYTIYNLSGQRESGSLNLLANGIYFFTFSLVENPGDYIIRFCDDSTREIKVREVDTMSFLPVMLAYLFIAGLVVVGLLKAQKMWAKVVLATSLSIVLVIVLRLSGWFVEISLPAEDGLISALGQFYGWAVKAMYFIVAGAMLFLVVLILNMIRSKPGEMKRKKEDEWENWGRE